jgi:hypothetical protein
MISPIFPFIEQKRISPSYLSEFTFGEDFSFWEDVLRVGVLIISFGIAQILLAKYVSTPLSSFIPKPSVKRTEEGSIEYHKAINDYEAKVRKFKVACFRFCAYSLVFLVGVYSLVLDNSMEAGVKGKSWFARGIYSIFEDWPKHRLHSNVVSYVRPASDEPLYSVEYLEAILSDSPLMLHYYFGLAFYMFGTITLVLGVDGTPASDFTQMFVHHMVTIFLIGFSWYWKLAKYGSLILVLHDLADPFMEIAKAFLYCGRQNLADVFFGIFAFVFVFSRCVVFPRMIIYPLW